MGKILTGITSPEEIKLLSNIELEVLSNEIRDFLIEKVSTTGGHLSSNLGVVELTLSLFKSLNLAEDRVVWDVGHQCYVHKILTGRKDRFDVLRKYKGLSGFPKRCESKYDAFDTGHSSTSISAALGLARARDIKGENNTVVAVIGDGALTGGMALEALNDVGFNKTKLIVILNDNQMSIAPNVGGLSDYLNKVRFEPGYNDFKKGVSNKLNASNCGKKLANKLSKLKDSVKQLVVPSMFFEDIGIKYLGPIDGHDIQSMCEAIEKAKKIDGPVIIHTVTQKGKGYELAEKRPDKFHGVSPFDLESGEAHIASTVNYSKVFGDTMMKLAEADERVVAITAAMPDGTGLKEYAQKYPDRFFDVGIAECHATTLAAGMAAAGLRPYFAVYSTFLQRAYDQIVHDVCIQNLPVTFAIDRAGLVGEDGETHQGIFDLSYLIHIPNITILAPKHLDELPLMLEWAKEKNSPVAIRYPRGADCCEKLVPLKNINYGKWEKIQDGDDVIIIAVGKMVQHTLLANEFLLKDNVKATIINATFVKPLDKELLNEIAKLNKPIITIEDNQLIGGFGSYVLNNLNELSFNCKFKSLGFDDEFVHQGDTKMLYKDAKLDSHGIVNAVKELLR